MPYPIRDGKIYFLRVPGCTDGLDRLKGLLKNLLGKYYYSIGISILAPTYPFNYRREFREEVENILGRRVIIKPVGRPGEIRK